MVMVLRRGSITVVASLCCGLGFLLSPVQADWPQFLGPNRDGIVRDAQKLPHSWPANGPKVLWKVPVGAGYAGPAIFGDSVLLLDREDNTSDVLRRLSLSTGKEIWHYAYDAPGKLDHDGSRSTPATDGKLVYSIGPFGDIIAVRFSDGKLVWKANLLTDWQSKRPNWGVAESPLLYGDLVIVAPFGRKAAIVAYDKATGAVRWTTPPAGKGIDYSSPVPMTIAGRRMIVASGKQAFTIGVDAATGEQLWSYDGYLCKIDIPSPTLVGDGRILLTGGYGAGAAMIQVEKTPEGFTVRELWANHNMGSKIPQPVVSNGYIYGNSSDTRGGLLCMNPDGEIQWATKTKPGFDMGNLLLVDGLIFIIDGAKGDLVMAEASPQGYHELGRAEILQGPEAWAPLAYSHGKLVIRDQHTMACLDLLAGA